MAKQYRTIKLLYNVTSSEMDVFTDRESIERQGSTSIRRTLDLTAYEQLISTNVKRIFSYSFENANQSVYDFFYNAYAAKLEYYDIVFHWEGDDGTFEIIPCTVSLPQAGDETVSDSLKIYRTLNVSVTEL